MAYITPAGQAHAYHATGAKPWKVAWVIYGIAPVPHHPNLPSVAKPILCEVDPRPWEQAVQGLIVESSRSGDPVLLEHWTGLVHGYAVQMMQRNHSSRLWRLWQSVQADLSLPWTLDGLARNSGFDKENLRRICLSETGRSPMQQVTRLRMQHAVSLLASDQKVQAVAEAVGYENVFAFSTAFKRQMGRSPKEFRPLG